MELWVVASIALAVLAVSVPILMRVFRRSSDTTTEERRVRQEAVIEEFDRLLAPVLDGARRGERTPTGPGTAFHEAYLVVRQRIQQEFRSFTGIRFDREIGYALTRPGSVELPDRLAGQVAGAKAVLREEMAL